MAIEIFVAKTARALTDAFELRRRVYVDENGLFTERASGGAELTDRFDSFPETVNIVAYRGEEPVGALRVTADCGTQLPPERYYDFSAYRRRLTQGDEDSASARLGAAGMLAVDKRWRHRRDVVMALFKVAIGVGAHVPLTHVIVAVNHDNAEMYTRIGFEPLDEAVWAEEIGNWVVPMAARMELLYQWAFGALTEQQDIPAALTAAAHRLILSPGERVFQEGDIGTACYVIEEGEIEISRGTRDRGEALTLATLGRSQVFGELALVDEKPRSADACAKARTELLVLDAKAVGLHREALAPEAKFALGLMADRLRAMGDLAMVLAHGTGRERLEFALEQLGRGAREDRREPGMRVIRAGPDTLARTAGVSEQAARDFLDTLQAYGMCDYSAERIRIQASAVAAELGGR